MFFFYYRYPNSEVCEQSCLKPSVARALFQQLQQLERLSQHGSCFASPPKFPRTKVRPRSTGGCTSSDRSPTWGYAEVPCLSDSKENVFLNDQEHQLQAHVFQRFSWNKCVHTGKDGFRGSNTYPFYMSKRRTNDGCKLCEVDKSASKLQESLDTASAAQSQVESVRHGANCDCLRCGHMRQLDLLKRYSLPQSYSYKASISGQWPCRVTTQSVHSYSPLAAGGKPSATMKNPVTNGNFEQPNSNPIHTRLEVPKPFEESSEHYRSASSNHFCSREAEPEQRHCIKHSEKTEDQKVQKKSYKNGYRTAAVVGLDAAEFKRKVDVSK